jgi:hypothetical protein
LKKKTQQERRRRRRRRRRRNVKEGVRNEESLFLKYKIVCKIVKL